MNFYICGVLITTAIVDDDTRYAGALRRLLEAEQDIGCVGYFQSLKEARLGLPQVLPDVVLLDVQLGDGLGSEQVDKLYALSPRSVFLICTAFEQDDYLFEALKKGAHGYIIKSDPPERILSSVRSVARGGHPMSELVAGRLVEYFREAPRKLDMLTPKENELLALLAEGLLYKEIAGRMDIQLDTVKKHATTVYRKLQVSNRMQAVSFFQRR